MPLTLDLRISAPEFLVPLPQVGGVPAVLKQLLKDGLIDGSCLTVTGASHSFCILHFLLPQPAGRWLNDACQSTRVKRS